MKLYRSQDKMTQELFRNPTAEYRSTPFWAWNGTLEKENLPEQIEIFKEMGFGGFHMHSRTGMNVPYLSKQFMSMVKLCVEKAKEKNMLAWLYDEDRYPSGAAGGIVTKDKEYRAKYMLFTPVRRDRPEAAVFQIELDEEGFLKSYRRIRAEGRQPDEDGQVEKGIEWFAYLVTQKESPWFNNQTYVNTLDKKSIDRFIEVTYESYKEAVGEDFGTVIPAIFTDEPQFSHKTLLRYAEDKSDIILPWTDDFPDTFRQAYGEEILNKLPVLVWEQREKEDLPVRYHYHDHIAERFTRAFADNCGAWCEKNGLLLTGHMMEEPTLKSQTAALGEAMRSYRSFGIPGIDILCNNYEYTTAKQAQSAARQYGREGIMSELYGVTTWDFDFRGYKLQGDWQAALGVTVRVPHLSWMTMKGEAKRDYPASLNYQAPWYRKFSIIEDHFARINTVMTLGKPAVKIAVVHPVESYWLHWGPEEQTGLLREEMDQRFQQLTKWLLSGMLDFDFLCEANLPEQCKAGSNPLQVGEMAYDAVILPQCETVRESTLIRLIDFAKAGGKLLVLGKMPELVDAKESRETEKLLQYSRIIPFEKAAVYQELEDFRLVEARDQTGRLTENLFYQLREEEDRKWLFLAQGIDPADKDMPVEQEVKITVRGRYEVILYDTMSGEIRNYPAECRGSRTIIYCSMYQQDSMLFCLKKTAAAGGLVSAEELKQNDRSKLPYTGEMIGRSGSGLLQEPKERYKWNRLTLPQTVEAEREEPNVYILDYGEFALDDEPYRPEEEILKADNLLRKELGLPSRKDAMAQPWTSSWEKAEHKIRLRFTLETEVNLQDLKLAMEDAEDAVILLDGLEIPVNTEGWYVDKCIRTFALPDMVQGTHRLEIILPFGRNAAAEWCYLLGNFGVKLMGSRKIITGEEKRVGFGDITSQGYPFYSASFSYHIPVKCPGGRLKIHVPQYRGDLLEVLLDGQVMGEIVCAPYDLIIPELERREYRITLKMYGNRYNTFGPIHYCDPRMPLKGPETYRMEGDAWSREYRLHPLGILTSPVICVEEKY